VPPSLHRLDEPAVDNNPTLKQEPREVIRRILAEAEPITPNRLAA
jgi:hypothetical protein